MKVMNGVINNNKNRQKQVAVCKKTWTATKYCQIAKPDEFLFTIKFWWLMHTF